MIESFVTPWRIVSKLLISAWTGFSLRDGYRSFPRIQLSLNMNQAGCVSATNARQTHNTPDFLPETAAIISADDFDLRGTRENSRLPAQESSQSPPMGPDLTDAPSRLAGRAQICILSGRTTRRIGDSRRRGRPHP